MKKFLKPFIYSYIFTWLFVICFFLYNTLSQTSNFNKILDSFLSFVSSKIGFILIHIAFILFFSILLIIKYFVSVYKKESLKILLKKFTLRLLTPIFIVIFSLKFLIYINNKEDFKYEWISTIENKSGIPKKLFLQDGKLRGMNVFRIGRKENSQKTVNELIKSNIEWVALLPYFYQETENSTKINTPEKIGIWSKRDSTFINDIRKLHEKELYVMLKPHLWMNSGWRSNINFKNINDWDIWFSEYRNNMIHYALMAQETNVELFCIGTELKSSLKQVPDKWLTLIKEIKSIYEGKITYAANWDDSFEFKEFWNELDYLGIQAYYPLTKNKNPNLKEIKLGWNIHIEKLKEISNRFDKKIIFTEIGYRNDVSATIEPWVWGSYFERLYTKKSDKTQLLAYQALFEKLWKEPWFAGIFPWEWNSHDFPIYQKPAQNIITIWYNK